MNSASFFGVIRVESSSAGLVRFGFEATSGSEGDADTEKHKRYEPKIARQRRQILKLLYR